MFVIYLIVYLPPVLRLLERIGIHAKPHIHVRENHYDKICKRGNNLPYGWVARKRYLYHIVKATST